MNIWQWNHVIVPGPGLPGPVSVITVTGMSTLLASEPVQFRGRPETHRDKENTCMHIDPYPQWTGVSCIWPTTKASHSQTNRYLCYNAGPTPRPTPLTSHLPVLEVTSSPRHAGSRNSKRRAQTDPRTEASKNKNNKKKKLRKLR